MMMKVLESGGLQTVTDNFRIADEDNLQGKYEFERVKKMSEGDTSWAGGAQGKSVEVGAWLVEHPNFSVFYLDYGGPEKYAAQVDQFLGKSSDVDKMAGVVEPDLYRQ